VTRGAEGSTPVAHGSNFTIRQVTSAATLGSFLTATPPSQQAVFAVRGPYLTPWYAALANRQFARANIVCIGDSITEGQGATAYDNRWIGRLRDMLRSHFPTPGLTGGGRGYINIVSTGEVSYTWPTTISGSPPGVTTGPKAGGLQLNTTGQQVVYNLTGDSADIMWEQVGFGGTFSYKVDSGSPVNISTNGGSTQDGKITHISLGSAGAHTLTLAWVSGSANVDGVVEYNGDFATGIQVHDCGHYGWQTSSWTGTNTGVYASIAALNPGLVIISLGVNDQFLGVVPSTYQANLQTIISDVKTAYAAAFPSVPYPAFTLNMLPPRQGQSGYTFPWFEYAVAAYSVAAADTSGPNGTSIVSVMDFTAGPRMPGADTDVYGLWHAADLVHPSNSGHQFIADCFVDFLSQK
jgi:lysophospholipase L1-like esterase